MPARKPTVLVIEDDPTTRKVLTGGLAMAGIQAHIATSPMEASDILSEKNIDVIVTDLMMPGIDGVDLIQAAREAPHTKHIPIVVFTSGGNLEMMERAALLGATEILQKHNTPPAKLIERILKVHEAAGGRP
jgi:CheY-like chemotaxis protein